MLSVTMNHGYCRTRLGAIADAPDRCRIAAVHDALLAAHAIALGGSPKYAPDFRAFDYVNADAPKGGEVTMSSLGGFEKLNPFILKGVPATGLTDLVFESLTMGSLDEPNTMYGL